MANRIEDYQRTFNELERNASMFWPPEFSTREAELSVIPKLLETQDTFIAILSTGAPTLEGLFGVLASSSFPANLFLKHLVVLADFGGEMLQRVNAQFKSLFPSQQLDFFWNGEKQSHRFLAMPTRGNLSNSKLGLDGKTLLITQSLTPLHKDVAAIVLFGAACALERTAGILERCDIGFLLGQPEKLAKCIKQKYILVSRITSGARSNSLGQMTQTYVKQYLEENLNIPTAKIILPGHIPGISHTREDAERTTTFDVVVSVGKKHVAIEVSFQVTTNSVIERKAGQARSRFEQIEKAGYKIAYVIDGAGNFQRETAVKTLCNYSHCTVAFSRKELGVLCQFLRDYFRTIA